MGIYENISELLGYSGGLTTHSGGVPVEYVGRSVSSIGDVTALLTLPADFEDLGIELTNSETMHIYGDDTEFTLVTIVESDGFVWVNSFKYSSLEDYEFGKSTQVPSAELRV